MDTQSKPPQSDSRTPCYGEAHTLWVHRKEITQNQYISYSVAHFRGYKHEGKNKSCADIPYEPFAASIRKIALAKNSPNITDTTAYEELFQHCLDDDIEKIQSSLFQLREAEPMLDPVQPLAILAVQQLNARLLSFALRHGAVIDRHLAVAVTKSVDRKADNESKERQQMMRLLKPHRASIREKSAGRRDPNGRWTIEQIDEWFGDMNW